MFLDFWNTNDAFILSGDVIFEANGSSILHEHGKCMDQLKWLPRPNIKQLVAYLKISELGSEVKIRLSSVSVFFKFSILFLNF